MINPTIPVFISSPMEVESDRRSAYVAIQTLAPRLARLFGVTLVPLMWEEFAPISSYDGSPPQTGILSRIQPFSIFVGILWNTCGTPVGKTKKTGTEIEFDHAIKHRNCISILSYFRKQSKTRNSAAKYQQGRVNRLRSQLEKNGNNIITKTYDNDAQFNSIILPDLMEACLELIMSREPRKISDYYNFFKCGSHWRLGDRPLFIVYPPITDPGPGHSKPKLYWRQRLLPHVIYEDIKAIQDVEEAMRLLGRSYKTVTTDSPSLDEADKGDRVWICVPRNVKAQHVLAQLGKDGIKVRFRFFSDTYHSTSKNVLKKPETILEWKNKHATITIRSPLGKYLNLSDRPQRATEWRPAFGYSYCRDYAVIARFKVMKNPKDPHSEYFYHYFIGGIRGLGTWGIGYVIDHESSLLVSLAKEQMKKYGTEDVQLLLEVTYENYKVSGVVDVSEEPPKYFSERYSTSYIKKQLNDHCKWLPSKK